MSFWATASLCLFSRTDRKLTTDIRDYLTYTHLGIVIIELHEAKPNTTCKWEKFGIINITLQFDAVYLVWNILLFCPEDNACGWAHDQLGKAPFTNEIRVLVPPKKLECDVSMTAATAMRFGTTNMNSTLFPSAKPSMRQVRRNPMDHGWTRLPTQLGYTTSPSTSM